MPGVNDAADCNREIFAPAGRIIWLPMVTGSVTSATNGSPERAMAANCTLQIVCGILKGYIFACALHRDMQYV